MAPEKELQERNRPPLPNWGYKLVNPIMKLILNSPLHGLLSGQLMVLTFTGRKSGKRFSTPVGYEQMGDALYIFTHSSWWKNLTDNAPVTLRLRGKTVQCIANVTDEPNVVYEYIQRITEKRGEEMAQRMGFSLVGDDSTDDDIRRAAQGKTFIQIDVP